MQTKGQFDKRWQTECFVDFVKPGDKINLYGDDPLISNSYFQEIRSEVLSPNDVKVLKFVMPIYELLAKLRFD